MIAYLHGFNSGYDRNSEKTKACAKIDDVLEIEYDSFDSHDRILEFLLNKLQPHAFDLTVIGTSLGGYYAACVAHVLGVPSVLVNPLVSPYMDFMRFMSGDVPFENYVTKKSSILLDVSRDSYIGKNIPTEGYPIKPLVLISTDDEVLDARKTISAFSDHHCIIRHDRGHRFSDFSSEIPEISRYLNRCAVSDDLNC